MDRNKSDVLIIGCGPTGVVLAHLLGKLDVQVTILEKDEKIFPVPRATHVDEETLRNFQATGFIKQLEKFTSLFGTMEVHDENGKRLFHEEIRQPESMHGFTGSRFFDQPEFEKVLRQGLENYSSVKLLTGIEAISVSQPTSEVIVKAKNNITNEAIEVNALWVIGCDGGRSVTRASLNTQMDEMEPARDWIIVDTILKDEATAALLPGGFQYLFEQERLTVCAHGFGKHRRWEFQLNPGEAMPDNAVIKKWLQKYIELEKVTITRIAKYAHNSLVARQWRQNRILLAGDAAHMMPPAAGQGLCSGVRDAINLAWKLNAVLKKQAPENLLDTYEMERKPHLNQLLRRTLFFATRMNGDTTLQRVWRRLSLQIIEQIPPIKNYLRKRFNIPPALINGCLDNSSKLAGQHLPQSLIGSENSLSDDEIGYRFALITLPGKLDAKQVEVAKQKSMVLLHEQIDMQQSIFPEWLNKHQLDFVIVRPDKIIFGGGKKNAFEEVITSLEKWFTGLLN